MKEISTAVALSLASEGITVEGALSFDPTFEALTYILGWDVFTHELAEKSPWIEAAANIHAANPTLAQYGRELRADPKKHAEILADCLKELGLTVMLPKGNGRRTESPLASIARIAPGKPVVAVCPE